jgi:ABC-type nitrate/sulfonate/bicarbonate transport system substrate-binding protein
MIAAMHRIHSMFFALTLAVWLIPPPPLWSKEINIAYSTIGANNTVVWVARDMGFFKKQGLDPQVLYVQGGGILIQGMLNGNIPISITSGSQAIVSNLAGTDLVLFSTFHSAAGPRYLGVAKDIQNAAQLKGKKLAVSRFGSSSDFILRFALRKAGLDPEKDVAILQIGNSPDRLAAMRNGQISGTMLTVEDRWAAEKFGFRTLLDVYDYGFEALTVSAIASKKYLTEQRDMARAFMRGLVEAIHFTKTRPEETKKIMAKNTRISDPAILDQAYKFIAADYLQKPYPSIKGIQFTLQDLDRTRPGTAELNPLRFADMELVKELETNGFIDRVFGKKS